MEGVAIDYLADHLECVDALARWQHDQWAGYNPGETLADRAAKLRARAHRGGIPTVFVARDDAGAPLGSASLVLCDMDTRPEYDPWLASVIVGTEHRGRGIGSALVERCAEEARELGVDTLWLFTEDRMSLYARLGWETVERTGYRGHEVVVMARDLGAGGTK